MNTKTQILISWIAIILISCMSAAAIQPHINQMDDSVEIVVVETIEETNSIKYEQTPTDIILENHNFSDWSFDEKKQLTVMMMLTADPSMEDVLEISFNDVAKTASVRVLETYIDLLEDAGY